MSTPEVKIAYVEHSIDDVIKFFTNGFQLKEGKVVKSEWFFDPVKAKVIFKLFVADQKIVTLRE